MAHRYRLSKLAPGVGVVFGMLLAAIGCGSPHAPEQAERWAKAWIESLNSHRLQQVTPLLDPTATFQDPLTGTPLSGPALAYFLVALWNRAPESHYEVRDVNGNGEFVAVEWSVTDLGVGPATKPLAGVFLIHFKGDHINSVRGYYDTAALNAATERMKVGNASVLVAPDPGG